MMYGGEEPPCQPPSWFALFVDRLGRQCPRVDIDPSLLLDVELLQYVQYPELKPLAAAKFAAMCESRGLDADRRDLMLSRFAAVMTDPLIVARLHPAPELPEDD